MKCPACESPLHPEMRGSVEVDLCARCGGVWLDDGELESLLASDENAQAPSPHPSNPAMTGPIVYRRCPRCEGWLARNNFRHVSGVIIDTCPDHGVWLDKGEYESIRAFLQSGGSTREQRFLTAERRFTEHMKDTAEHHARHTSRHTFGSRVHSLLDIFQL